MPFWLQLWANKFKGSQKSCTGMKASTPVVHLVGEGGTSGTTLDAAPWPTPSRHFLFSPSPPLPWRLVRAGEVAGGISGSSVCQKHFQFLLKTESNVFKSSRNLRKPSEDCEVGRLKGEATGEGRILVPASESIRAEITTAKAKWKYRHKILSYYCQIQGASKYIFF